MGVDLALQFKKVHTKKSFEDLDPVLNATIMLEGRWLDGKATSVQTSQYFSLQRLHCVFTIRFEGNFPVMTEIAVASHFTRLDSAIRERTCSAFRQGNFCW